MAETRTRAEIIDEMIEMSCEMQRLEAENEGLCARLATAEAERDRRTALLRDLYWKFGNVMEDDSAEHYNTLRDAFAAIRYELRDELRAPSTGTTP